MGLEGMGCREVWELGEGESRWQCIFFPSLGSRRGRCFCIGRPPCPLQIGRSREAAAGGEGLSRKFFLSFVVRVCVQVCTEERSGRSPKFPLFCLFYFLSPLFVKKNGNKLFRKRRKRFLICCVDNIYLPPFAFPPPPRVFNSVE